MDNNDKYVYYIKDNKTNKVTVNKDIFGREVFERDIFTKFEDYQNKEIVSSKEYREYIYSTDEYRKEIIKNIDKQNKETEDRNYFLKIKNKGFFEELINNIVYNSDMKNKYTKQEVDKFIKVFNNLLEKLK